MACYLRAAGESRISREEDVCGAVDGGGEVNRVGRSKAVLRAQIRRVLDDRCTDLEHARLAERGLVASQQCSVAFSKWLAATLEPQETRRHKT
jgi:hypothetical protein